MRYIGFYIPAHRVKNLVRKYVFYGRYARALARPFDCHGILVAVGNAVAVKVRRVIVYDMGVSAVRAAVLQIIRVDFYLYAVPLRVLRAFLIRPDHAVAVYQGFIRQVGGRPVVSAYNAIAHGHIIRHGTLRRFAVVIDARREQLVVFRLEDIARRIHMPCMLAVMVEEGVILPNARNIAAVVV